MTRRPLRGVAAALATALITLLAAPPALAEQTSTPEATASAEPVPTSEQTQAAEQAAPATEPEPTTEATEAATKQPTKQPTNQSTEQPTEQPEAAQADRATPNIAATTRADSSMAGTTSAATAGACDPAAAPTLTISPSTVRLGGRLTVRGTGWCTEDGAAGSRIGVKIDEGGISRLDTAVHTNTTIWAIVEAAGDGTLDASFTLPDGTTGTSSPALALGTHSLRLLTGSLRSGDVIRSVLSPTFTTVPADTAEDDPALWGDPVQAGSATAWVQRDVSTAQGTLRIAGTGWTTTAGTGSTVAVKLNSSAEGQQYTRSGDAVRNNDPTIWALVAAAGDGSFDTVLDLPRGLSKGAHLTVSLFSGKFGASDVQRTVTTEPLAVDGLAWSQPEAGADTPCVPTSATPTATVKPRTVPLGGTITVTGAGWCHPVGGGSRIGVKIDDGAISRLDGSLHSNRTIWAIVQANHGDGTFTAQITIPDGTTATSTPALAEGAHTLRLLSGSLRGGDKVRTLDVDFVVGSYRPVGVPDPVAADQLTKAARGGLKARLGQKLRITAPGRAGEWVFLSLYDADGSPSYPWGDRWFQLGVGGTLRVGPGRDAPAGVTDLVVQSGEQDHVGELVGWARIAYPEPQRPAEPHQTVTPAPAPTAPAAPALTAAGERLEVPARPVAAYAELDAQPSDATARLVGTVLTARFAQAAGEVVFLRVYAAGRSLPAGWATLDEAGRVEVDLRRLAPDAYRVTAQTADGTLLGWVGADLGPAPAPVDEVAPTASPIPEPEAQASGIRPVSSDSSGTAAWFGPADGWLLALGALALAGTALVLRRRGGAA